MLLDILRFKPGPRLGAHRALMADLFRELHQAESWAAIQCVREATRLGDVGPAAVLRTIAVHAAQTLNELPLLASLEGLPTSGITRALDNFITRMSAGTRDLLMREQMSYRATLLGLHRGLDVVRLLGHTAVETTNDDLAEWCAEWLLMREPLIRVATEELAWFAQNADAGARASTSLGEALGS